MNMLAHRHLPPTPQDSAIARVSGQALSRFAQARAPLKLRVLMEFRNKDLIFPKSI